MANVADEMGPQGGRRGGRPPKLVRGRVPKAFGRRRTTDARRRLLLPVERGERVACTVSPGEDLPARGGRQPDLDRLKPNLRATNSSNDAIGVGQRARPFIRKGNRTIGSGPGFGIPEAFNETCQQADIRFWSAVMAKAASRRENQPLCQQSARHRRQVIVGGGNSRQRERQRSGSSFCCRSHQRCARWPSHRRRAPASAPTGSLRSTRPVRCGCRRQDCHARRPEHPLLRRLEGAIARSRLRTSTTGRNRA
jgi:hypothetical protein